MDGPQLDIRKDLLRRLLKWNWGYSPEWMEWSQGAVRQVLRMEAIRTVTEVLTHLCEFPYEAGRALSVERGARAGKWIRAMFPRQPRLGYETAPEFGMHASIPNRLWADVATYFWILPSTEFLEVHLDMVAWWTGMKVETQCVLDVWQRCEIPPCMSLSQLRSAFAVSTRSEVRKWSNDENAVVDRVVTARNILITVGQHVARPAVAAELNCTYLEPVDWKQMKREEKDAWHKKTAAGTSPDDIISNLAMDVAIFSGLTFELDDNKKDTWTERNNQHYINTWFQTMRRLALRRRWWWPQLQLVLRDALLPFLGINGSTGYPLSELVLEFWIGSHTHILRFVKNVQPENQTIALRLAEDQLPYQ